MIAEEEAEAFWQWLSARAAAPGIGSLRRQFTHAQEEQVGRLAGRLARLSPEAQACLQELACSLTKLLLHEATVHLRREVAQARHPALGLPAAMPPPAREAQAARPLTSTPAGRRDHAHHVGDGQES
jgi:glutamyl-tRNA reductase